MLSDILNLNLQKTHPLTKLICTFIFLLTIIFTHTLGMLFILILLTILMLIFSRISYKIYFDKIAKLKFYLLFVFLVILLLSWSVTFSFVFLMKFILFILYLLILVLTTSFTEIIYSLKWVLRPLNRFSINTSNLSLNIACFLKFVLIFTSEYDKIVYNYKEKGYDYRKDFFTYFKYRVVPNFKCSFRKIKKLKKNIHLKLYDYSNKNYNFELEVRGKFDKYIIIIHGFILLIIILRGVFL